MYHRCRWHQRGIVSLDIFASFEKVYTYFERKIQFTGTDDDRQEAKFSKISWRCLFNCVTIQWQGPARGPRSTATTPPPWFSSQRCSSFSSPSSHTSHSKSEKIIQINTNLSLISFEFFSPSMLHCRHYYGNVAKMFNIRSINRGIAICIYN